MIKRYYMTYDDMDLHADGNWVKFEDHEKEVERLKAVIAIAEEALNYYWNENLGRDAGVASKALNAIDQLKQQPKKDE